MFKTSKADTRCRLSQQGLHQAQQGTVWVLTSPNHSAVLTFFPGGCRVYPYYGIFYRTNSQPGLSCITLLFIAAEGFKQS